MNEARGAAGGDSQVTCDNALGLDPETKGESWKSFKHRSVVI